MFENIIISIIVGIAWSQVISHFGASILLHRYYCHKQFSVPVWFEIIGLSMLMIACIKTPIGWIASHRMHHQYSDSPNDPHSPVYVGFWKVITTTWTIPVIPVQYAKDLYCNPRLVFCHKYWLIILIAVWIVSFIISPYFLLSFAVVPFIFAKVGFGLLNALGHRSGPTNVPWLNLFVAGEGFHKNHHINSKQIRLHKYDLSGWIAEFIFKKK